MLGFLEAPLSFFFDGFGYSDKSGPASNIAKLYAALIDDVDKSARRFYYSGLGAEFDPENAALAAALGDKAGTEIEDKVSSAPKDIAKGAVLDVWKESERLSDKSYAHRAVWTAGEVVDRAKKQGKQIVKTVQKPVTTVAKQGWKTLRKEWRALWKEVVRHPWRAAKDAGAAVAKNTAGYAAESLGLIRDSTLGAALLNTGVDTRLKSAETDFKAAFALAKAKLPVHRVNVAIFGYDMGGGIALAFSKLLIDDICASGRYQAVEVKIRFMGLFDCVTNRYDDNLLTGFIPLSNKVSSEMTLLPEVECCVHYAAAHELRFYKPLTMIGGSPGATGNRQELLFPGSQVDVGGGAEAQEAGVLDGLARYPVEMMYNRAYGAGIPMPSLTELRGLNPGLHSQLTSTPEIDEFQRQYRRAVTALVEDVKEISPAVIRLNLPYVCTYTKPGQRTAEQETQCYVPPEPLVVR
ncbi:phospholipase effector Tle1 domain-containing protein [Xanthomonas populi]